MKKVIVHDGIFHADDVMSIALIKEFVGIEIPVERKRNISAEEFADPDIWIVDVGGRNDRKLNLYDHHQDKTLPAACMLVLLELHDRGYISDEMRDELFDPIWHISDIDCNGPEGKDSFHVNALIKSFNSLNDGFYIGVLTCIHYIKACKNNVSKIQESLDIWNRGEQISTFIRVCDAFPIHWKRYNKQVLLIYPNDGKWNLLSVNSENFPIWNSGKASFVHANKFLAVFEKKEDAIECAQATAYNVVG